MGPENKQNVENLRAFLHQESPPMSDFLGSDQNTMYLLWFGLVPVHVAIIGWNSLGRDNAVK